MAKELKLVEYEGCTLAVIETVSVENTEYAVVFDIADSNGKVFVVATDELADAEGDDDTDGESETNG